MHLSRTTRQVIVVAVLAVAAFAIIALFAPRHGFFDLNVYYGAVNYWAGGGEIYDYLRPNSTYGFTYPPFAAVLMSPMALLPWGVVAAIHAAVTLALMVWLLWTLLEPLIRTRQWTPWFAVAVAFCLLAVFEPMRETFLFGQVNLILLALVVIDLFFLRGTKWGGVGIGLATAIKLTPGVFIIYLLLTKRWREALVASGTAAAATLVAAAFAPDASREFWTSALWDTDRVGNLAFISNQSLQGMIARLNPDHPSKAAWAVLVVAVLALWAWRVRKADVWGGLALTGIVGLLISPVTWIHHLVWLIPAFVLLICSGKRWHLVVAAVAYVILCSRVVWAYQLDFSGVDGFLVANAYVWICLLLLIITPVRNEIVRAPQ